MQEENSLLHIFSDRLRLAMERRKIKQPDLAKASGVSQPTLSRWLSASTAAKIDDVKAVAVVLRYSVDWLLGRENQTDILEDQFTRAAEYAERAPGGEAEKQARFTEAIRDVRFQAITQLRTLAREINGKADVLEREWGRSFSSEPKAHRATPVRDPFPGVDPAVEQSVDAGALDAMRMSREQSRERKGKAASTTGSKSGPSR